MRTKRLLIGVAVMALMVGGVVTGLTMVVADEGHHHDELPTAANWEQYLNDNDGNNDGMISKDEFAGSAQAFARIDADGDGLITREEAIAAEARAHQRQGRQGALQAQVTPQQRWSGWLEEHDADNDGRISREEFGGPPHAFARMDADGDGFLTEAEVLAATARQRQQRTEDGQQGGQVDPQARGQRMMQQWDADNDARISREEFRGPDQAFDRMDADGDGFLTEAEVLAATPRQRQQGAEDGTARGQVDPQARWQRMLQQWDANNDGKISREEFLGPDQAFDRMDADGDGFLTEAEVLAGGARQLGQGQGRGQGRGAPQQ